MNKTVSNDAKRPRRKRRTAAVARKEILDAARKRLIDDGPDGLRLKVIADDVGISHSAILHHFGNREILVTELRDSGFESLAADLRHRIAQPTEGDPTIAFFEQVAATLGDQGYGRLLVWQLMTGNSPDRGAVGRGVLGPDGSGGLLDGLAKMLHTLRSDRALARSEPVPALEETKRIVVMAACTLLGEALTGEVMVRSAGLGDSSNDRVAFRGWFAKIAEEMVFPSHGKSKPSSVQEPVSKAHRVRPEKGRRKKAPRGDPNDDQIIDIDSPSDRAS
jgi:AcrR family transcriptional regulator